MTVFGSCTEKIGWLLSIDSGMVEIVRSFGRCVAKTVVGLEHQVLKQIAKGSK